MNHVTSSTLLRNLPAFSSSLLIFPKNKRQLYESYDVIHFTKELRIRSIYESPVTSSILLKNLSAS